MDATGSSSAIADCRRNSYLLPLFARSSQSHNFPKEDICARHILLCICGTINSGEIIESIGYQKDAFLTIVNSTDQWGCLITVGLLRLVNIMRSKKTPVGQFFIEGLGDTDEAYEYVYDLMPRIGEVVIWFNALESDIDHILCHYISDRSDQMGLMVVSNMMYTTKIDLFERFTTDFLRVTDLSVDWFPRLMSDLRECGTLRNKVVHANWMYTNDDGYTQVKIRFGKQGLEHELTQFTKESMDMIIAKIESIRADLDYLSMEVLT